ncbi:MFS transporter [Bombiscardovia coagulans]|nr:MFS transporter [Bombiscardovia coagulans]
MTEDLHKYWARIRIASFISHLGNGVSSALILLYLANRYSVKFVPIPTASMLLATSIGAICASMLISRFGALKVIIFGYGALALDLLSLSMSAYRGADQITIIFLFTLNGFAAGVTMAPVSVMWSHLGTAGDRTKVFATNAMLNRLGIALGSLVGGFLIGLGNYAIGFLIDAISFFGATIAWSSCRQALREVGHNNQNRTHRYWHNWHNCLISTLRSWQVATQYRWLFCYLVAITISAVPLELASSAGVPTILTQMYTQQEAGLWAAIPAWALLAGNIVARLYPHIHYPGLALLLGDCCVSVAFLALSIHLNIAIAVAVFSIGRFSLSIGTPHLQAFIGDHFQAHDQTTMYALLDGSRTFLGPLGLFSGYYLLSITSASSILLCCSVICIVVTAFLAFVPGIMGFTTQNN